jgi:hypothetical protein
MHSKTNDDPFKGGSKHMVGNYERSAPVDVVVSCRGKSDRQLAVIVRMSPKFGEPKMIEAMNTLGPVIKYIVDDKPVQAEKALVVRAKDSKFIFGVAGQGAQHFALSILSASSRIAISVEVGGKRINSYSFKAEGAMSSAGQLASACGMAENAPSPATPGAPTPRRP